MCWAMPGPARSLAGRSTRIDGARKTRSEWAEERGIPKGTLYYRLKTMGLPIQQALGMNPWGKPTAEVAPADPIADSALAQNLPQVIEPATPTATSRRVEGSRVAPDVVDAGGRPGRAAGQERTRTARDSGPSPRKVAPHAIGFYERRRQRRGRPARPLTAGSRRL